MERSNGAPIALRVMVVAGILALVIGGGIYIYSFFNRVSISKTDVKPAANGVAVFPEKLPAGFVWKFGAHVSDFVDAVSAQAPDDQELRLTKLKNVAKKPEQMLDEMTSLRKHVGGGRYIYEVASNGSEKIADAPMIWKVVSLDKHGERTRAFYAIASPDAKTIVLITGTQTGETYNLPETMEFLKSIKSWQSSSSQ
jgi:hypothetical protein